MTVERVTRINRGWQQLTVSLAAVLAGVLAIQGLDQGVQALAAAQKDKDKDKKEDKFKKEKKQRLKTEPLTTIKAHKDWINRLAVSTDGTLLATASRDGTVKIWHWPSGKELRTILARSVTKKDAPDKSRLLMNRSSNPQCF